MFWGVGLAYFFLEDRWVGWLGCQGPATRVFEPFPKPRGSGIWRPGWNHATESAGFVVQAAAAKGKRAVHLVGEVVMGQNSRGNTFWMFPARSWNQKKSRRK